jgi:hypothetical protein
MRCPAQKTFGRSSSNRPAVAASADPAVAREALGRACEQINLWWEHRHFQK